MIPAEIFTALLIVCLIVVMIVAIIDHYSLRTEFRGFKFEMAEEITRLEKKLKDFQPDQQMRDVLKAIHELQKRTGIL